MSNLNPQNHPRLDEENPGQLLTDALALVETEMDSVNKTIQSRLKSDIALINTLGAYIVKSGGKRLRPLILLLCAKSKGYQGQHHILLAAVIEFIHTATLLHDDVVDASATRRGQPTANDVWGNEASVLVGDFLYSRSFEMMVETENMAVMDILASTTNAIAEGEVQQLLNAHSPETSEQQYLETIHRKTAKLFESAAQLGGVISEADKETCDNFAKYGMYLGTAFQLVDDILDYNSTAAEIGKDIGDDLSEGKPTLPIIYALKHGNHEQQKIVKKAIEQGDRSKINEVIEIVNVTGALDYTLGKAKEQSRLAIEVLNSLDDSKYKNAMIELAHFSTYRSH
jgi:octaprenyl-diphosphate synthase